MKTEFYNQNTETFGVNLVMCGKEICVPNFKMPPHIREYYLIHYIKKGTLVYEENGRKHIVKQGDIFAIYPENLTMYYNVDEVGDLEFCWIGFVGNAAEKYVEYAGLTRDNPVLHLNNTDFEEAVLKLIQLFEKKYNPSEFALNIQLLKCFESIEKSAKVKISYSLNYVDIALAYIDDNYMRDISMTDIADFVKLNRSHLFKIFKLQTGLSVSQYLIKYRINKACEFFREYDFTIGQVAQMVGIDDIYYFSRLFKKIMGITPSEYKKSQD